MEKPIMKDVLFLQQPSEPATEADKTLVSVFMMIAAFFTDAWEISKNDAVSDLGRHSISDRDKSRHVHCLWRG